jgi:hypothetical protein
MMMKMTKTRKGKAVRTLGALAVILLFGFAWLAATEKRGTAAAATAAGDYISGAVTSSKGPEAGVWVVAETTDLPTKYVKIVVTDDRGRYVLPQLPTATYQVFVRGYGLVDSARVPAKPGQHLDLKAIVAPDPRAAAQFYPANYWYSLAKIPAGKLSQEDFIGRVKYCLTCHQIGDPATREIPEITRNLGPFHNSLEAWDRRTKSGPAGAGMSASYMGLGDQRSMFADWSDRIAAGEYPTVAPPRPSGVERNIVLTLWDWGTDSNYLHDEASSDLRNPTVNANGPVYGVQSSGNSLVWLDPAKNATGEVTIPSKADPTGSMYAPSPYWGNENIWLSSSQPRAAALDQYGRVWTASRIRGTTPPDFCKPGSSNKFVQYFPIERAAKQVAVYDPEKREVSEIDTCFTTDHNDFGADGKLFFGAGGAVGWVDTPAWDKTHNSEQSQGWVPGVLDTNGDGKITKPWTEPNEPVDPTKDHRIFFSCYSISVSPTDGSIWCSGIGLEDKQLVRIDLGSNPPETSRAEVYNPPTGIDPPVLSAGGVSVDTNGVAWQNWRTTDYITSFDRRKCKVLNGPSATGPHCPEGWTLYRNQGPTFQGGTKINSDLNYLISVDRYGTLGLGKNVPVTGAVNTGALQVLVPTSGQFVMIRVPYPMGFFTRGMQGRIDDPKAGWKGRGFWTSYNPYTAWHLEGGKGTRDKLVKVQMRPDPLAK